MKTHRPWKPVMAAFCLVALQGCQSGEEADQKPVPEIYRCLEGNPASARIALNPPAGASNQISTQDSTLDSTQDSSQARVPKKPIQLLQGYPPVVGMGPDTVIYVNRNTDSRGTGGGTGSKPVNSNIGWVEPVNFLDSNSGKPVLAPCVSITRLETSESFAARNVILDGDCRVVREFDFQYTLAPGAASAVSYLAWDAKDAQGNLVREGRYFWNIEIERGSASSLIRNSLQLTASGACPLPK